MWLVPDKRNVPAIRFLEYTEDYARTTLGKIGNTYNGLTGKSAEDFGQGSPYITYKSIFDNSRVDISRVEYVQISDIEQHNKKQNKVARGDIFFTTSSETPEEVGMTSVLLDNIEDCYLNSFCFGYRVYSQEQYLPEYLRFYLRSYFLHIERICYKHETRRLAAISSLCALLDESLPEREPLPDFYKQVIHFFNHLEEKNWLTAYIRLEALLLKVLGFGLDLSRCAGGGDSQTLAYVSPKTAKAVSKEKGEPYRDKLLVLPRFLWQNCQADEADLRAGLFLTGYFLAQHIPLPRTRLKLL